MNDLTTILVIPETMPADFYENGKYLEQTKTALEVARSLVHEIDDEGRKKAQADAAAIRKYVKTTNGFTLSVFRSLTDKVKLWRDGFTDQTKLLDQAADDIINKFEGLEAEKKRQIELLIIKKIAEMREAKGVREEFMTRPEFKISLTWITPTGQLTKKITDWVFDTVHAEIEQQRTYDERCSVIQIQCLEEGMTPFSPDVLGEAMFTKSDDVFLFKLKTLIDLEKDRMAKQAERIERDKQAAVDKALRDQQAEAIRRAKFELEQQQIVIQPFVTPPQPEGTRLVRYVKTYQARLKPTISNEKFKAIIDKTESRLPKLKKLIDELFSEPSELKTAIDDLFLATMEKETIEHTRIEKALVSAEVFDVGT
jgi:hypothetical protein